MWICNDTEVTIRLRNIHETEVTVWEQEGATPPLGGIVEDTRWGYNQMQKLAKEVARKHCGWVPTYPWVRGHMDGQDWVIELGNMEEVA